MSPGGSRAPQRVVGCVEGGPAPSHTRPVRCGYFLVGAGVAAAPARPRPQSVGRHRSNRKPTRTALAGGGRAAPASRHGRGSKRRMTRTGSRPFFSSHAHVFFPEKKDKEHGAPPRPAPLRPSSTPSNTHRLAIRIVRDDEGGEHRLFGVHDGRRGSGGQGHHGRSGEQGERGRAHATHFKGGWGGVRRGVTRAGGGQEW